MEKDNKSKTLKDENAFSICDLMKEDTSKITRKLESKVPSHVQNYSNLYTEYLHGFDDLFGTCYITEKEFFDQINIDQGILRPVREHSRIVKENYLDGVEMRIKFLDEYVKMRIFVIKTFDGYFHIWWNFISRCFRSLIFR